ncbi:hypothetical protein JCM8547_008623 [Rhodosporidiobolus lusitaniae]
MASGRVSVGTKTVVVHDCELHGDITLGSGTILQPRCTIIAHGGPIIFGQNNIVEETAVIVNRRKEPLIIGDGNLFEVGCRIESPTIGSHNTFGIKSRTSPHVAVGSHCVIGAGCVVLPSPFFSPPQLPTPTEPEAPPSDTSMADPSSSPSASPAPTSSSDLPPSATPCTPSSSSEPPTHESLPDHTHVFGSENRRRTASGEGTGQAKALFVKHWEYLRETLPKYNKLKMF